VGGEGRRCADLQGYLRAASPPKRATSARSRRALVGTRGSIATAGTLTSVDEPRRRCSAQGETRSPSMLKAIGQD